MLSPGPAGLSLDSPPPLKYTHCLESGYEKMQPNSWPGSLQPLLCHCLAPQQGLFASSASGAMEGWLACSSAKCNALHSAGLEVCKVVIPRIICEIHSELHHKRSESFSFNPKNFSFCNILYRCACKACASMPDFKVVRYVAFSRITSKLHSEFH